MSSSPNWGKGKNKQGLTWHHHEDTKRLVLVDYNDHRRNHGLYHPQEKAEEVYGEVVDQVNEEN